MEDILLVDEDDNIIGKEEKLSAHKSGKLHRAFSVFVFNSKKELLQPACGPTPAAAIRLLRTLKKRLKKG